jgi:hypothetical protein
MNRLLGKTQQKLIVIEVKSMSLQTIESNHSIELNSKEDWLVEMPEFQQENISGGVDFGFSLTAFKGNYAQLTTGSTSGPNGSTAMGTGTHIQIKTLGANAIVLGAPGGLPRMRN